jgi:hypothetical protein
MPYADTDVLSRDRRRAEGEEDDVDNGFDDKHINGPVRGPRRVDTGVEGWWRSWCNDNINNDKEEGRLHPTLRTTAMCELVERLRSAGRNRQRAEEGEGDINDGGDKECVNRHVWGLRQVDTGDGQWRRLQRNGDNNDDIEEGGLYPTPRTTATHELAARQCSAGIPYTSEASLSLSDVDDSKRQRRR